jgi:hypothetical protein
MKEITRRKKKLIMRCFYFLFVGMFFFFYCADVGVIVAAHDNFLGISVSGVGISCPVTVSGTIGIGISLLLFNFVDGSGLQAANLP